MATKTISLKLEAYEKLRAARSYPGESFSQVVLRATWPEEAITGSELLERCRTQGAYFTVAELDAIDELKRVDRPPEDKWNR